MGTDRKSRLSERYARVWDLLASVAAADACGCDYSELTVHGHDAVVRNKRICVGCAAQQALSALAAAALGQAIRRTQWREMPKAITELDSKEL